MSDPGGCEIMDTVQPLNVNRFEDVNRFVPVPLAWVCLGRRDVQDKKGKTYTLVEYSTPEGLTVGLFVTDMGEEFGENGVSLLTVVRKGALGQAIERAEERAVKRGKR